MKQVRSNLKKLAVLLSKENADFENKLEKGGSKKEIHLALRRGDIVSDLGSGWTDAISNMVWS